MDLDPLNTLRNVFNYSTGNMLEHTMESQPDGMTGEDLKSEE